MSRHGQGSVFRRPRSPHWWIQWYVKGPDGTIRRKRESSGTTVKKEAVKKLTTKLEEARKGKGTGDGTLRFSELVEHYEENELPNLSPGAQRTYRTSFTKLLAFFSDNPRVDSMRRADGKRFMAWRTKQKVTPHTVARDFRVLKLLFTHAVEYEIIELHPFLKMKPKKGDPRTPVILSDDQLDELLDAASDHPMLRLYILLLAETGTRSYSEALKLEWTDVDLHGGFIHVRSAPNRRTKSGKSRHVPMTPRLVVALRDHAARFRMAVYMGKRSPYVFHHTGTVRNAVAGERIKQLRRPFDAAAKKAKLPPGFRKHDLRHRRVTTWLANGANPVHVKEAVGHADLATTMGYTHLLPEHLRALVTNSHTNSHTDGSGEVKTKGARTV